MGADARQWWPIIAIKAKLKNTVCSLSYIYGNKNVMRTDSPVAPLKGMTIPVSTIHLPPIAKPVIKTEYGITNTQS